MVYCPDDDHMEEEVQLRVQVEEEEEIGETHGEEQSEEQGVKDRTTAHREMRSCRHLSQCVVQHIIQHAHCAQKKVTCEMYCLQIVKMRCMYIFFRSVFDVKHKLFENYTTLHLADASLEISLSSSTLMLPFEWLSDHATTV